MGPLTVANRLPALVLECRLYSSFNPGRQLLAHVASGAVQDGCHELLQLWCDLVQLPIELRIWWDRAVVLFQLGQDDPAPPPPPDVVLAESDVTARLRALAEVGRVARILHRVG